MKKWILLCAVFCLTASAASAQWFALGMRGGVTMLSTDVSGVASATDKWDEFKSKNTGWNLGLMAHVKLPLGLYVQPELMYNHAAYEMLADDGSSEKLKYSNIDFPVLVGFKVLFMHLDLGPTFTLYNGTSGDYDVVRPDAGYQIGLGVTLLKKVSFDVRYHGYFEKKWKDVNFNDIKNLNANEGYWGFSVGYYF